LAAACFFFFESLVPFADADAASRAVARAALARRWRFLGTALSGKGLRRSAVSAWAVTHTGV
jgi:hypothetical protein